MNCGVVEIVKHSTLRWFGHVERMSENGTKKRTYKSGKDAVGVKGRFPGKLTCSGSNYSVIF